MLSEYHCWEGAFQSLDSPTPACGLGASAVFILELPALPKWLPSLMAAGRLGPAEWESRGLTVQGWTWSQGGFGLGAGSIFWPCGLLWPILVCLWVLHAFSLKFPSFFSSWLFRVPWSSVGIIQW